MEYFCGLDVAVDETAVCVVDEHGEVHLTVKVETDPDALFVVLKPFVARLRRVGHEAGSLSPWLHPELVKRGLPVICLETQHVRAAMSAQRNKTDAADALGIAHHHAHGLVPPGSYQDTGLLSDAAFADSPAQPEPQGCHRHHMADWVSLNRAPRCLCRG